MGAERNRTSAESTFLRIAPLLFAAAVGAGMVTLTASCEETGPSPIGNHPDDSGVDAAADAKKEAAAEAGDEDGGEDEGGTDGGTDATDASDDVADAADSG